MCYLNVICFVCLSDNDKLNAVFHKETHNEIFIQVKYALPELTFLDSEVPVYICSSCRTTLHAFYTFKKNCLANYCRLKHYILKTLQEIDDTQEDQNDKELQISGINCYQPVKQEQQQDFELNIEVKNEDPLRPSSETEEQIFSELEMNIDNNKQLIKHEPEMVIVSNIKYENEGAFLSLEEQHDQETIVEASIDLKEVSLASEDSADRDIHQLLMNRGSESDDEQDSGSSVTSNDVLDKDEANSNNDGENQELQCSMCTQIFSDRSKFDNHLRIHIYNVTGLECLICNKKFSKKGHLYRHMKSELGIKDNECSICKKNFSRSEDLKRHKKIHLGIKSYECSICKQKFSQNGNLKSHMKSHLGIKDNECSICKKKFFRSCNLKLHMKSHLGVKDYDCSICKKKFTQSSHLKLHMKTHLGIKTYECSICKKTFSQGTHLNRHIHYHLP